LANIQENLLTQMGENNPAYIAANRQFERLSQPLNEFDERITGSSLIKMAPDNLKNFANRIFQNLVLKLLSTLRSKLLLVVAKMHGTLLLGLFLEEQWTLAKKPSKTQQGAKLILATLGRISLWATLSR
jgi:hypothetical protein